MKGALYEWAVIVASPAAVVAYGALGLFLLWAAAGRPVPRMSFPVRPIAACFLVAACLVTYHLSRSNWLLPVSVAVGTITYAACERAWKSPAKLIAGLAVVMASVSLAWWLDLNVESGLVTQPAGWWRVAAFALIAVVLQSSLAQPEGRRDQGFRIPLMFVFSAAGFLALANQAPYQVATYWVETALHHQGAFIGSALHSRAGLVPFYDIPLQYGLGPTLSVAAACSVGDCRAGVQYLAVGTTLLMEVMILRMVLATSVKRDLRWTAAATFAVFLAAFVWQGAPAIGALGTITPSVGGLRFLPVVLVAFLLFFDRPRWAAVALGLAVLWSPEVAAMSVAVFGLHETVRVGLAKAAARAIGITAGTLAGLVVVHRLIYGLWMQPDVWAEFLLHMPGRMPISPFGDFLLWAGAMSLAGWLVFRRSAEPEVFRRDMIAAALLFAASSYYLHNSHPLNVCNLMSFVVLVAARVIDRGRLAGAVLPHRVAVTGVAMASATVMLSAWIYPPFSSHIAVDLQSLSASAAALDPDVERIRAHLPNPDRLGVAGIRNRGWRLPGETAVWTAMDPWALWIEMPSERRKLYIARSAARLHQAGWVIVADDFRAVLDEFRVAYEVSEVTLNDTDTAGYTVAYLRPLPRLDAGSR